MNPHFRILIIGAGSAGISVASRLLRQSSAFRHDIALIDPAEHHFYQPLWTLVGGGAAKKEFSKRDMEAVIPFGTHHIQDAVSSFDPEQNQVHTAQGQTISYDYLVVAPGIDIDWQGIKGLQETLGKNGVCSNYSYETVDYTWQTIRNFSGGKAVFTHPNSPVKCGGAPQKIMYLADEAFSHRGVRGQTEITFNSANPGIFDVEEYKQALEKVIDRKQIQANFRTNLIEVRGEEKEAVFENLDTGETFTTSFDMLHVTPPMRAPAFLAESPLAGEGGWVDVHKHTLQHTKYENVFGLGDASNLPTSKTGAAIRKQAPVVAENILALLKNGPMDAFYDGYSSCPIVTGYRSLILAEFDYFKEPKESMPFNQAVERRSMYHMKKDFLPIIYWNGMLKGVI
ncbi:NAD(P)/FAD-dependent oxidoreductase [Salisediminibacterium halotolerans]|uniref:Sulfide:quinone oxidoreductase n=1 Tax=Salisediminibacterium halotolerans TaxID=517425 RepID=A0A1H9VI05_9BACI|nr:MULTISPECIES: FAD/NAD(P)-binding oxidoreductase [Salisediminibacterium]RLJ75525.1 sulfide:quinone oxidoreductase [Actinophytocola xinjiangensis]RPE89378.1 sulfide:quinone oxidoreductase [Salisediminibacterium halotolerans]TWG36138.1 sulfide:quinone oxidoreductase [Salisediminibacterium halotolerans]SES21430.1 sulfide:quinone oxidoreductase [Salisediminibacterium haloalkalitolerans]GEL08140.1 pyridine nucleotide-disulfide oxidoreductase [Salisediminibacterium halotolerans]